MPDLWMDVDAALSEVPVNIMPLLDDTDFKSREVSIAYDAAGMDLVWNFFTPAGAATQTAVTPTTAGDYDWVHLGDGMYTIEIPASGGASINNDTEGFGFFSGFVTGVLPWRGPVIGFRDSDLNDKLIESAWSATRGLTGTALPDAVADAAGGVPVSDAGGLDIDTILGRITANVALASVCTEARLAELAAANLPTDIAAIPTTKTGYALSATGLDAIGQAATGMIEIAKAIWDRVLTAGTHDIGSSAGRRLRVVQSVGYEGGCIWIDTINGAAGTDDYENGTVDNPVNTLADAITLSASVGILRFCLAPGSSISLSQAFDGYMFIGRGWTLALNSQNVSNSIFVGATVSGICSGASGAPQFLDCFIGTVTVPPCRMIACGILNGITAQAAGDFFFDSCYSEVAGTGAPSFDFGAALGNEGLNLRHYSGGIEIKNMGGAGTDNMSLEGHGQLIINANCSAGTVAIRGNFTVTDNASGALTLSEDARYDTGQVNAQVVDGLATDTYAEPGQGAPAATASLAAKINYLFKAWRNKSDQDATTFQLYNDDASTVDQKATVSEAAGTVTKGEVGTGP